LLDDHAQQADRVGFLDDHFAAHLLLRSVVVERKVGLQRLPVN
jgi:hypothetical protein